jgi:two-component system alkaline phosphatase synthesis response regulator PhoP
MVRALEDNFTIKGYKVRKALDGKLGLTEALKGGTDLIILDIMLPEVNGFEICSQVRNRNINTPIIMLTAKDQEQDIVMGLNLGADDYVTKPFSIKQLLARAEALLRRTQQPEPDVYRFGDFKLDVVNEKLFRNNVEVPLSPKEFKVMHLLVKRQSSVLTRDEILSSAFGNAHFVSVKDIDGFIKAIRGKIEPDSNRPVFIHTVIDIGYKFEPASPDERANRGRPV